MEITISASYDAPTDAVKAALHEAVSQFPQILPRPRAGDPPVRLWRKRHRLSPAAWTTSGDYWDVYYRLLEAIRPAFARHGVEMPYSQLDVHLIPRSPKN